MSVSNVIAGLMRRRAVARPKHPDRTQAPRSAQAAGPAGQVVIPTPETSCEDRACSVWQMRGLHLARQEDWPALIAEIRAADNDRVLTPGGMPAAELLIYGARADVVGMVEHALAHGTPPSDAPLLDGIEALETVLAEMPDTAEIAAIVAQAHADLAWAWRGNRQSTAISAVGQEAYEAHMDRAREILAPFRAAAPSSPALMQAVCALPGCGLEAVIAEHTRLIDLNPAHFRAMRALGHRLLPQGSGSYDVLDLEARRIASRHFALWGAGGYTWTMMDAIAHDDEALASLDVDQFIRGLEDIFRSGPDPSVVNLLAAYCGVTMRGLAGSGAA